MANVATLNATPDDDALLALFLVIAFATQRR
jgi:hypothetical protein